MFSIQANTMYTIDENGNHSVEISYNDSDGINVGAYAEGDSFEQVITDIVDQLDEAIAEHDDDKADVEEMDSLQQQIADLQQQIAQLEARNAELEKRHQEKYAKFSRSDDLKKLVEDFRKETEYNDSIAAMKNKISDFPFNKWWS